MKNNLNCLIFSDIYILILKDKSFRELLEYSLLSNQIFKTTQNIIKNQIKSINLKLKLETLVKYIKINNKDDDDNDEQYGLKLIQYKEVEHLILNYNKKKNFCFGNKHVYPILPKGFRDKFKSLKSIHFDIGLQSEHYRGESCEYTHIHNEIGLCYTFERFLIKWEFGYHESYPISNKEEFIRFYQYSQSPDNDNQLFEYSFQFLKNYNPTKLYLQSCCDDKNFEILKINNLLKQTDSIKSIKFLNHNTTPSFLKACIDNQDPSSSIVCKDLTSLTVLLTNFSEDSFKEDYEPISSELFLNTVSGLSKSNLKRLIFNPRSREDDGSTTDSINLPNLFKSMIGNTNLKALGLNYFEIKSSDQLTPLKEFPNINTLYCNFTTLPFFSNHINENNNITHLKIIYDFESFDKPIEVYFEQFIKSNISKSLKSITITNYRFNKHPIEINLIKESFNILNKNKHLYLFIKNKRF